MDEILNRWSSSLDFSIREFSRQAAEVAAWDKVLLRGGDEISSLLSALTLAEEKQRSIDSTLDYLESSQKDLSYLVGEYESQIDSLLPNVEAGNLTSADVERERSYALAEKLNGQLDDVSKNLSAMITELNTTNGATAANGAASGGAGEGGLENMLAERDGSIAQIVAILNAHLGSLKWIDSNAGALRGRLEGLRRGQV